MVKVAKKAKKTSKTSRKDLKGPDQFVEATTKGAETIQEYRAQITIAVVGILVLAAGIFFFQSRQKSQATSVTTALTEALKSYQATVSKTQKSNDDTKVYKSRKEKYEAAIKAFSKVVKGHGASNAGALAYLYLGHSNSHLGKYKEALAHYESFLKRVSDKDPMYFLGLEGMAKTEQAMNKSKDGLARLQAYTTKGAEPLRPFALMSLAEYHQRKKNYKQARHFYSKLTKLKEASADFKTTASRRLAVLP